MAMFSDTPTVTFTTAFKNVEEAEHKRIEDIRKTRHGGVEIKISDAAPLSGLALSGGGIRSAAFGVGVLHSLENRGILGRLDYLSTVSGGGYIGSAWTYLEALKAKELLPEVKQRLKLGTRDVGAKTTRAEKNRHLDHIRGHGNYVTQGDHLGIGSVVAMILRSIMVGLIIWLPIAALTLAVACHFVALVASSFGATPLGKTGSVTLPVQVLAHLAWIAALLLLVMAAISAWRCVRRRSVSAEDDYTARLGLQRQLGNLLKLVVAVLVLASLPLALMLMAEQPTTVGVEPLVSGVLSLLGGLTAFWSFFKSGRLEARGFDVTGILAAAGAALMLYGGLLLAVLLADAAMALGGFIAETATSPHGAVPMGLLVLILGASASVFVMRRTDLNVIALHRLYRDRLMETFLPNIAATTPDPAVPAEKRVGSWHEATEAEKFWLHAACPANGIGPYHLINTNAVLVRSTNTGYAGRGGDSFVLSPLYCGSDATGWRDTRSWIRFATESDATDMIDIKAAGGGEDEAMEKDDHLSLATAMAISGAAVNPNAAASGRGPTRNRFVALAMSLLNLRLACWMPHPNPAMQAAPEDGYTRNPTWWLPGGRILTGSAHHENERYIELSDGGHFENLGLYELVRRRVKTIIVADAGCDPRFCFADLGNALERCRVDFGVDIRFHDEALDLRHLLPLADGKTAFEQAFPLARRGVAVARIRYPADKEHAELIGQLLYVKTTITHELPADVYAYKLVDPSFPDQSTGDQWFDEAQFEAYRELGYGLVENFMDEFGKAAPSGATHHPANDPFGYGQLIDWLHGREPLDAILAAADDALPQGKTAA